MKNSILLLLALFASRSISAQQKIEVNLSIDSVKKYEHTLDDVTEVGDTTYLKQKLIALELAYQKSPDATNTLKLGIIYHEVALNFGFLSNSTFTGYSQKSYDLLHNAIESNIVHPALMPLIESYRASALALLSGESSNLKLLKQSFELFNEAVEKYAEYSSIPEFLRGSVAENLPFFMVRKRKYAKTDFSSIIAKYEANNDYASAKVMSYTYWAWAKNHKASKNRSKSLAYLNKAVELDPNYEGGRERSEQLISELKK